MKKIINIFYYLNFLPSFSVFQSLVNFYVSSRFLSLIFLPILLYKKRFWIVDKSLLPVIFLFVFFILFSIIAMVDSRYLLVYIGYIIAFIYIIMFYYVVRYHPEFFLNFMIVFLIFNAIYVFIQIILLNLGLASFSMIHSNLPAQNNYEIPVFISEPFFRYTGLFNESSPFAFYLIICFVFFDRIGYKKGRKNAIFSINVNLS